MFLPNDFPDFSSITPENLCAALDDAFINAQTRLDTLCADQSGSTFKSTVLELEYMRNDIRRLGNLASILGQLKVKDFSPVRLYANKRFSEFGLTIWQNTDLFDRVKKIHESRPRLNHEDQCLLQNYYDMFVSCGANLSEKDKAEYKMIDARLIELESQYSDNSLHFTKAATVAVEDTEENGEGLTDTILDTARARAKEEGKVGQLVFGLTDNTFRQVIERAESRTLREAVFKGFHYRPDETDPHSNWPVAAEILSLRARLAALMGSETYALDTMSSNRMASHPDVIRDLWQEMLTQAMPKAKTEVENFKTFAQERDGVTSIELWDTVFYRKRMAEKMFNINLRDVENYLSLESILDGLFDHIKKLTQDDMVIRDDLPGVAPESRTYEVRDSEGQTKGYIIFDMFDRPGEKKQGGSLMTLQSHYTDEHGREHLPILVLRASYEQPAPGQPLCLKIENVITQFHESGHMLQDIHGESKYWTLRPGSGPWDAIEIASKFSENYVLQPDFAQKFMRHHATGEPINPSTLAGLEAERRTNQGIPLVANLRMGVVDLAFHSLTSSITVPELKKLQNEAVKPFRIIDSAPTDVAVNFDHIFVGSYAAGFYSYIWSEMFSADIFDMFRAKGDIYEPKLSARFKRHMLGNTALVDPLKSYQNLTGRKQPSLKPLLYRYSVTT